MVPRPVIGICTALERARWGVWDQPAMLLARNYVDAVQRAGGLALMLPPDPWLAEDPAQALDLIDGLVLTGGADIDPACYGQRPHPETVDTVPERDAFEIALTRAAIERDKPLLGICRGMQLINVALGGTLLQHLPEHFGHGEHRRAIGSFDGAEHDVRLRAGSLAARAAGETEHATKSHHHQGIDRLGEGLVVSGVCTLDELPEAIEWDQSAPAGPSARRFVLGVQWHPEADAASAVVGALVRAAASAAAVEAVQAAGATVEEAEAEAGVGVVGTAGEAVQAAGATVEEAEAEAGVVGTAGEAVQAADPVGTAGEAVQAAGATVEEAEAGVGVVGTAGEAVQAAEHAQAREIAS